MYGTQIPETMWRVAKSEDSSVVVAVAESWDWIHYLVEEDTVDYNYRCLGLDYNCSQEISINEFYLHIFYEEFTILNSVHTCLSL